LASCLMSGRDSTAAAPGVEALSGAPQSLQNLARGLLSAPQRGHFAAISEAHPRQTFAPSGFSAEHFGQRIDLPETSRLELHLS
jgi:hypothetical protein